MSRIVRPRVTQGDAVDNLIWQIKHMRPGSDQRKPNYALPTLPFPEREYRFHPTRLWRFDLCWPGPIKLAVEIDGGIWQYGRHNRATSMLEDLEKMNEAVILGYRVLHFTPQQVITDSGRTVLDAYGTIVRAFQFLGFIPGGKSNG